MPAVRMLLVFYYLCQHHAYMHCVAPRYGGFLLAFGVWLHFEGMEQQQIQERGAQSDDERQDGAVLRCLLSLPVLRHANRHV